MKKIIILLAMLTMMINSFAGTDSELEINTINIMDFNAVADGKTDNTVAIQSAIDFLGEEGGKIFFPEGVYCANGIKLRSNIIIEGEGHNTVLKQLKGLSGYQALLGVNQGGAGTLNPEGDNSLTGNINNISIKNIKLKGTVEEEGFSEWVHLLALNSASNIIVDNVLFEGFRGDAIFIGVESTVERHNSNIKILNSIFDGLNKNNRNGISILDGKDIIIENNYFTRLTREDMPGAIDIEPNNNSSIEWTVLENINIIKNKFVEIGKIAIVYKNPNCQSEVIKGRISGIVIEENEIDRAFVGIYLEQAYEILDNTTPKLNIRINNNIIKNCFAPLQALGTRGVELGNNYFENCESGVGLGINGKKVLDISISNNIFSRLGKTADVSGVFINVASHLTINDNYFIDCGASLNNYNEGYAITFYEGNTDNVTIERNVLLSPNDITTKFIYVSKAHIINPNTNIWRENII